MKKIKENKWILWIVWILLLLLFSSCSNDDKKPTHTQRYSPTTQYNTNTRRNPTYNTITTTNIWGYTNTQTIPEPQKNPYQEYDEYYDDIWYDYYWWYDGYNDHYKDWIDDFGEEYELRWYENYDDYLDKNY